MHSKKDCRICFKPLLKHKWVTSLCTRAVCLSVILGFHEMVDELAVQVLRRAQNSSLKNVALLLIGIDNTKSSIVQENNNGRYIYTNV